MFQLFCLHKLCHTATNLVAIARAVPTSERFGSSPFATPAECSILVKRSANQKGLLLYLSLTLAIKVNLAQGNAVGKNERCYDRNIG